MRSSPSGVRSRTMADRVRERGSLPMAMLLTLVGTMLSVLLMPIVLLEINGTRSEVARVRAENAAEAGLDVALGEIRSAHDSSGHGVLTALPCGPLTGGVSAGGTARYQVTIDYLEADPQGMSDGWIETNHIACITGGGTRTAPGYALLRAKGTDKAGTDFTGGGVRSLQATYRFSTELTRIPPGGLIRAHRTLLGPDLCLDAGSAAPAAGTVLQVRRCSAGSTRQTFSYDTNLNLVLTASRTASNPLGMCLDAGSVHYAGEAVRLRQCAATTQPRQQWSLNDYSNFEGTSNGSDLDGTCFNVAFPGASGSPVVLGTWLLTQCYGLYDAQQAFSPEGSVGAGAAGPNSGQIVNFEQYGRCIDVTKKEVSYGYLIVWPCKQAPDQDNISWNQKWELPAIATGQTGATGTISTNNGWGRYCLRSPLSTASGRYVTVTSCSSGSSSSITWTVRTTTGLFATNYTILDTAGNCLSPTDQHAASPDLHSEGALTSKLVVAPCDGSLLQKWNAPPTITQSSGLLNIGEK